MNNQLTGEQVVMLQLRLQSALSFYSQRPEKAAKAMTELLTMSAAAASELQKRQKAMKEAIEALETATTTGNVWSIGRAQEILEWWNE